MHSFGSSFVVGNSCENNGFGGYGVGLLHDAADGHIEGNSFLGNDIGLMVTSNMNFISRNTASGNTTNWWVHSGNICVVVEATIAGAISGDSGGTAPGHASPRANFTY